MNVEGKTTGAQTQVVCVSAWDKIIYPSDEPQSAVDFNGTESER
jgi:hypothetical protein